SIERNEYVLGDILRLGLIGEHAMGDTDYARVLGSEKALERRRERISYMPCPARDACPFARGQRHGRRGLHIPVEHHGAVRCDSREASHPHGCPIYREHDTTVLWRHSATYQSGNERQAWRRAISQ